MTYQSKLTIAFVFVVGVILMAVDVVLAAPAVQEALPEDPGALVGWLVAGLVALGGLVSTSLVDWIKTWPIFKTNEDQSKLSGAGANLVAALVSLAVAGVEIFGGYAAGWLEASGVWAILLIVFSWPATKAWYEASKMRSVFSR